MWPQAANREKNGLSLITYSYVFLENNAALHSTMGLYNRSLHNESQVKISTYKLKNKNMGAHTPTKNNTITNAFNFKQYNKKFKARECVTYNPSRGKIFGF